MKLSTSRFLKSIQNQLVFLKKVWQEFTADNCPLLAASISYYVLFSLFPLTLVVISTASFIFESSVLEMQIMRAMRNLLPVSSEYITSTVHGVVSARGAIGIIAALGLIWSGTSVFKAVRISLNTAWGIRKPRSFLYARLIELVMMIGTGLLLLFSVVLTAGMQAIHQLSSQSIGSMVFNNDLFGTFMGTLVSAGVTYVVFLLLFKYVPNTMVRWKDIWLGALAAMVCFEISKRIFIWFVGEFGR